MFEELNKQFAQLSEENAILYGNAKDRASKIAGLPIDEIDIFCAGYIIGHAEALKQKPIINETDSNLLNPDFHDTTQD